MTDAEPGHAVRQHREAAGMTLEQLSERLQSLGHPLAPTVLSRIERGTRELRVPELVAISLALDITPGALLPTPAPGAAAARADGLVDEAWDQVLDALTGLVASLVRRYDADPETFAPRGLPPLHITVRGPARAPVADALAALGVAGAIDLHSADA